MHFNEIVNRPPPTVEANIQEAEVDLDISINPPTREEVMTAIKTLKNGKAPSQDNVNAELFKTDLVLTAEFLQPLIDIIC